jgi:hypothetical protein
LCRHIAFGPEWFDPVGDTLTVKTQWLHPTNVVLRLIGRIRPGAGGDRQGQPDFHHCAIAGAGLHDACPAQIEQARRRVLEAVPLVGRGVPEALSIVGNVNCEPIIRDGHAKFNLGGVRMADHVVERLLQRHENIMPHPKFHLSRARFRRTKNESRSENVTSLKTDGDWRATSGKLNGQVSGNETILLPF